MKTDHSIASFWKSYALAEMTTKLLTGKAEGLAPDPMDDMVHTDESPNNAMLEVLEHHQ